MTRGWWRAVKQLPALLRTIEWWDYKLATAISFFYATAFIMQVPIVSLWSSLLATFFALIACAIFAYIINDITDRKDDLAAGKPNRLTGNRGSGLVALVAGPVLAGLAFAFQWHTDWLLVSAYLTMWLAFVLYSVPPFRWKSRGLLGVFACAAGDSLFPTLVAVLSAFQAAHQPLKIGWIVAAGTWAFAYGLRGIVWHQLNDTEADRTAMVGTFVQRHSPRIGIRLVLFFTFPLELVSLAALFWLIHNWLPFALLLPYWLLVLARMWQWHLQPIVVEPHPPRYQIVLEQYYNAFFPLAILIASSLRHSGDTLILAAHLLLFPTRPTHALTDSWILAGRPILNRLWKEYLRPW
jgi:4-hydroxybenzoate polyprenyltransferase